jgi:hypothetical protein
MMRGAERTFAEDPPAREQTRHRMQLRGLERLVVREARQDRGQAPREHRLAGPRRPDQQEVVTPRRGDLERATRLLLSTHLGEVDARRRRFRCRRVDVGRVPGAPEEPDDLGERRGRHHAQPLDLRGLGRVGRGDHDARELVPGRGDRNGDHARGGQDLALERQLAEERNAGERANRDLRGGREHGDGDREVQPGPVLAEVPGRQVHHHAPQRPLAAGVLHGGPDPFSGILHGRAGHPGDRERREPAPDEGLDRDRPPADPEHRDTDDPSVHATDARSEAPAPP